MSDRVIRVHIDPTGFLDEIVGHGPYHLECMGDHWFLRLGSVSLSLGVTDDEVFCIPVDHDTMDQAIAEWAPETLRDDREVPP